jgi:hypothetical protein
MATMRPFDEVPEEGQITFLRNQAMFWLQDSEGVEYVSPKWLSAVIDAAWQRGYGEAQRDMREALGFVEARECPCCQADAAKPAKVEVTSGG